MSKKEPPPGMGAVRCNWNFEVRRTYWSTMRWVDWPVSPCTTTRYMPRASPLRLIALAASTVWFARI